VRPLSCFLVETLQGDFMTFKSCRLAVAACLALALIPATAPAGESARNTALQNLKHVIVVMQENHSFDNYFGTLAYVPGGVYHPVGGDDGRDRDGLDRGGCRPDDHRCVDGLTCKVVADGTLSCSNANIDADGSKVFAFHNVNRCVKPDLDHGWVGTHREANFADPNAALRRFRGDGFARQNDLTEQIDNGQEGPAEDETMGFYTQAELPFYYDLAQKFAISDRHFCSVLGPTFPNRSYSMAATSFGHLTTNDEIPPLGGYKPLTGTIFDLLEAHAVTWANYFQDVPSGGSFRLFTAAGADPHFLPYALFLAQVSGVPGVPALPEVSFVDPNFGFFTRSSENDEHPPADIQRGQAFLSQLVNAVRNGPYWKDSIIFITYDEHGGFYDHVKPPQAPQGGARTPDGIAPGQCADASNLPASAQPGGGAQCATNQVNPAGNSVATAAELCAAFAANPTGPFPSACASFDQLGFRVPFIAVSPFAKPHYVPHAVSDHTSVLALIENRFMTRLNGEGDDHPHLTGRDQFADTLEDMFDFENSPSLNIPVGTAAPPADDCGPTNGASATP
jgi:phospholipase C